jgi:mannose-1-phosphate guanylyltransferase
MLDIWLDVLADAGVDEVLLNTHHLAPLVEVHVAQRSGPPLVHLSHEPVLLGSAGTLHANRAFVTDEDVFLVVNADNLTDFDLGHLLDAHRAGGADATLAVFRAPQPSQCGILEVADNWVVGFEEKPAQPRGDLANAGIYAFAPVVLDAIPQPLPRDIGFDLLPHLVGRARALDIGERYFADIGTPEALSRTRHEWESRANA